MYSRFSSTTETVRGSTMPWWLTMIAGIAAFIVGLLFLVSPRMTLIGLVQFLGVYWLVTGILTLVSLCIDPIQWGWKLVAGILGILAGLVVMRDPLWSALFVPSVLLVFLGIDALIIGVTQVIQAFRGGGFSLTLLGALNIIWGGILLANPLIGVFVLPLVLGVFGVVGGITVAMRAFVSRHQETSMPFETTAHGMRS